MGTNIKDIQITDDKIFKIGIDKISIYNFNFDIKTNKIKGTILEDEKMKKITITGTDEFFKIISTYYKDNKNKLKENNYNLITFNPNKILYNNNILNATPRELNQALEKIENELKENEININFENAKIKEIEININIPVDFLEFKDTFRVLLRPLGKWQEINAINQSEKIKESTELESLFAKINNSIVLRIYDKTKESEIDNPKISRIEFSIKKEALNYYLEKLGKENNINTLLENKDIIKNIFIERINKLFKQSLKYIENKKKLLKNEYIAFKKTNHLAISHGRKAERGVYNYLEKFDIFDYNILIDIIKETGTPNQWREIQIIKKKYSHLNNIEKLNYLIEYVNKAIK